MKLVALAAFTRVFRGFVRETRVVDPLRLFELHAVCVCDRTQAFLRSVEAGALHVLGQFASFGRRVEIQIERTPLHVHVVLLFQPLDHTLADVAPRSDVIGEDGQFEIHVRLSDKIQQIDMTRTSYLTLEKSS